MKTIKAIFLSGCELLRNYPDFKKEKLTPKETQRAEEEYFKKIKIDYSLSEDAKYLKYGNNRFADGINIFYETVEMPL